MSGPDIFECYIVLRDVDRPVEARISWYAGSWVRRTTSVRAKLRPVDGDLATRNRGHQSAPRIPGSRSDSLAQRFGRGCGDRGQRSFGARRADDERDGWRPVRPLQGWKDRGPERSECVRARAARPLVRLAGRARSHRNAIHGNPYSDYSKCSGWLGENA